MKPEFGNDLTNLIARQSQLVQTRLAGRAVIKVVNQCNEAKNDNVLNLSECQLMQVPDAVYHLMRNTPLIVCNLSGNMLSKITPKFSVKFPLITELNISYNKMSKIPDELADCVELKKLDLSHNAFTMLPKVIFKLPKIKAVNISHNFIMDVEESNLSQTTTMEELDIRENPLTPKSCDRMKAKTTLIFILSPPQKHEWDDL